MTSRKQGSTAIVLDAGLQVYLRQINDTPLLSAEEERELAAIILRASEVADLFGERQCSLADKEDAEEDAVLARERMVKSNLRLVVNIAKKYARKGMPLSDLIEEGNLGLMRAVEGYDPALNTRFSTYASWWIKQAIKRALINSGQPVHIPAYMVEMIAKFRQARDEFVDVHGRQPSLEELAAHLNMPERKVRIIKRALKAIKSAARSGDEDSGAGLSDLLADTRAPAPEESILSEADTDLVQKLLNEIDEREATILRLRFGLDAGEGMTLKDIGAKVGLTRERVRQIERDALRKLNEMLDSSL